MDKLRLFSVGPVNMFDYSLDIASKQVPYFRTAEFSQVVFDIEKRLLSSAKAPKDSRAVLLTASGTGAMEAIVQNLDKHQKSLVVNGGSFGDRFEKLLTLHNIPHDTILLSFEEELSGEHFAKFAKESYQAVLVNIHETSIGKYYSPEVIKKFCQDNQCYLIVDAISSYLADEYDMEAIGADVTILSSQKGLALYPGLAMVLMTKKFIEDCVYASDTVSSYLDIKQALVDGERGQTPFTPALSVIYQLQQRLMFIDSNGGVQKEIEHCATLAKYFRQQVVELGFALPMFTMSNCLTTIICPKNNAVELFEKAKKKNIFLTPCGGVNKDKLLRIGHIGNLTKEDFDVLLKFLKEEI